MSPIGLKNQAYLSNMFYVMCPVLYASHHAFQSYTAAVPLMNLLPNPNGGQLFLEND